VTSRDLEHLAAFADSKRTPAQRRINQEMMTKYYAIRNAWLNGELEIVNDG
jgi:hypothetical protein